MMYLGFFFMHWASTDASEVARTDPVPLDCPFCKQSTDAIIKIYNIKTKHYDSFTIGKGDFSATITCRNCTTEGKLPSPIERKYINTYRTEEKYKKIVEQYTTRPEKAMHDLEKLINKSGNIPMVNDMKITINKWKSIQNI